MGVVLPAPLGVGQGDVLGPPLFAVAFRKPVEALRAAPVAVLVEEHGYSPEDAEAAVMLGAYLDDVVGGLPAEAAARVPSLMLKGKTWILEKPNSRHLSIVSLKSSSVSPGCPTITTVEID